MGLGSVGGFLPTIIKGLGYTNAKVSFHFYEKEEGSGEGVEAEWWRQETDPQAQLFTVPPYVVALVFMLLLTSFSDHKQTRGIPAACVFLIGLVGWTLLLTINAHKPTHTELHVRYFACICVVVAGYTNIPIVICKSYPAFFVRCVLMISLAIW